MLRGRKFGRVPEGSAYTVLKTQLGVDRILSKYERGTRLTRIRRISLLTSLDLQWRVTSVYLGYKLSREIAYFPFCKSVIVANLTCSKLHGTESFRFQYSSAQPINSRFKRRAISVGDPNIHCYVHRSPSVMPDFEKEGTILHACITFFKRRGPTILAKDQNPYCGLVLGAVRVNITMVYITT